MKSWNICEVLQLNLKTILYGYENNEIVINNQLHEILSENFEKTKRFLFQNYLYIKYDCNIPYYCLLSFSYDTIFYKVIAYAASLIVYDNESIL